MRDVKGFTAKKINAELRQHGTVWQCDYFDRWIRSEKHLLWTNDYIEQNPVKANLVSSAALYSFGSASKLVEVEDAGRNVRAP